MGFGLSARNGRPAVALRLRLPVRMPCLMLRRAPYLLAKMLTSGQFTMNPVDWKVSLAVPDGVMLWAWVPTSACAREVRLP
jgi:hypothetical protein